MQRLAYIDNLKAILIILVVMGHFWSSACDYSASQFALSCFNFIYSFHMPLFLFCSGLFAARSFKTGRGFLPENAILYLVLYLIFQLLISLESIFIDGEFSFNPFYASNGSWYLLALAGFMFCTPVLAKMKFMKALALSLVFSVASGLFNESNTFLSSSRFFTYLPWFVMGFYITSDKVIEWRTRLSASTPPVRFAIPMAALGVLVVYFVLLYFLPAVMVLLNRRLSTGLHPFYSLLKVMELPAVVLIALRVIHYALVAMISIAVMALCTEKKSFLTTIGERTLQIYIAHLLISYIYQYLEVDAWGLAISPWWVIVAPPLLGIVTTGILALPKSPNTGTKKLKALCTKLFS